MPKKQTQEDFISDCIEQHKSFYSYQNTIYNGATGTIIVTCPIHGDFTIRANLHRSGAGCQKCSGKYKKTTESFIAEAKLIHGEEFDYSEVVYKNNKTPVKVTCNKGHTTYVIPQNHLNGSKCCVCSGNYRWSQEEFIAKCIAVHNGFYTYEKTKYTGSSDRVTITCSIHGDFVQQAYMHYSGQGCPKCKGHNKTTEDFIVEARQVHGESYDYSKSIYVGSKTKLIVTCKKHGDFEQSPKIGRAHV